jgi:hypothetical protein
MPQPNLPHTFIVAVARFPRTKLLDSEKVLMLMGSAGCAAAAAAAAVAWTPVAVRDNSREDAPAVDVALLVAEIDNSRDEAAEVEAPLDAVATNEEVEATVEDVTALCASGAALELAVDEAAIALDTELDTELDIDALIAAADEACEVTVFKVVAAIDAAGLVAAALIGNDPSPQRQEHAQEPSGFKVPVPLAKAPGEPTAGAADA